MDYREKYEQALENLKRIKKANRDNKELVDFIEYQYPELKESEDDRIKTNIIKLLRFVRDTNHQYSDECNESIAWLEKQGKVKHTCRNCQTFQDLHQNCPYSPIYQYTDLTDAHKHLDDETHCEFWLEKQGEQKPAWSEEDEHNLNSVINLVHNTRDGAWGSCIGERIEFWLKRLKERMKGE